VTLFTRIHGWLFDEGADNLSHPASVAHGGLQVEHPDLKQGAQGLRDLTLGGRVEGEELIPVLVGHGGRVVPGVAQVPVEALGEAHDLVWVEVFGRTRLLVGLERGGQACMGWLVQAGDGEHHEQDGCDKRGVHDG
jgi:hypothetical protein